MPAVQLARVKLQVGQLMAHYAQPATFVRRLHDLLDFYADRTYRPGEAGVHRPLLPYYHTPLPIMRQLESDLSHEVIRNPKPALPLADALWAEEYFETRLLAIHLLDLIPPEPAELLVGRVQAWAQPSGDPDLLNRLLASGRTRLQRERQDLWLDLIRTWLSNDQPAFQAIGLRALLSVVNDSGFQNLPSIFSLLSPLIQAIPPALHPEMAAVIQILSRRSSSETAYFLRQTLGAVPGSEGRSLSRLIRRCLPFFDSETQTRLRGLLTDRTRAS